MKILYLHGLDSHLQDDRRDVLTKYGEVFAPKINYLEEPNLFQNLSKEYTNINAIIGSSAGGLVGYFLAQILQKPCLLFNPALPYKDKIPMEFNRHHPEFTQVVMGTSDETIPYKESLKILEENLTHKQQLEIHLISGLGHSYPIETFKQEVCFFFEKIKA